MYVTDTNAVAPLPVLFVDDMPANPGVVARHLESQHDQVLNAQGGEDSELPPRACFYGRLGMRNMRALYDELRVWSAPARR